MRRSVKSLAAVTTAGAAVLTTVAVAVSSGPASAASPTFQINPASGPAGTSITVSSNPGDTCGPNGTIALNLVRNADSAIVATSSAVTPAGSAPFSWSGTLDVPGNSITGPYTVTAHCTASGQNFDYTSQPFTVTPGATTTTSSTSTTLRGGTTSTTATGATTTIAPLTTTTVAVTGTTTTLIGSTGTGGSTTGSTTTSTTAPRAAAASAVNANPKFTG